MDACVGMSLKDHGGIQVGQITFKEQLALLNLKITCPFGIYIYIYIYYGKEIWMIFFATWY